MSNAAIRGGIAALRGAIGTVLRPMCAGHAVLPPAVALLSD